METFDIKMKISFSLDEIIISISRRECLICHKDLDADLGKEWHLPLCNNHRNKYLMDELEEYV